MDVKAIRWDVQSRIKELYKKRYPETGKPPVDIPGFDAQIKRWKDFLRNTSSFESRGERVRKNQARRARLRDRARQIMADPASFNLLAIDIIPTGDETAIMQVGFTLMFGHSEAIVHFDIDGVKETKSTFTAGYSDTVPIEDAMEPLKSEIESAHFVVGHNLHNDFAHIEKLTSGIPKRSVLDTGQYHRFLKGSYREDTPKLRDLMDMYGIEPADMTVAGNHAHAAMKLMLVMLEMAR